MRNMRPSRRRSPSHREKDQGKGAGDRFVETLDGCHGRILADPYGFQVRKDPYRHGLPTRLKYRAVFKVDDRLVTIVQVRHTDRKVSKRYGP